MEKKIRVAKSRFSESWCVHYPDGEVQYFYTWIEAIGEALCAYERD
jgi:hypothetical protein